MSNTNNWKNEIIVGNTVVVRSGNKLSIQVVDRVTKTQIVIGNMKYRKSDGQMIGMTGPFFIARKTVEGK